MERVADAGVRYRRRLAENSVAVYEALLDELAG